MEIRYYSITDNTVRNTIVELRRQIKVIFFAGEVIFTIPAVNSAFIKFGESALAAARPAKYICP